MTTHPSFASWFNLGYHTRMNKHDISEALRAERARYVAANAGSSAKHEEAKRWLPGGDTRNSIFLGTIPHLRLSSRGISDRGCRR